MADSRYAKFVRLWKVELRAAEAAVDQLAEHTHRILARRYAWLAAIARRKTLMSLPKCITDLENRFSYVRESEERNIRSGTLSALDGHQR